MLIVNAVAEKDHTEKFDETLRKIYGDDDPTLLTRMNVEIREQIAIEASQRTNLTLGHALIELFTSKYIIRTALAISVMQLGILSGSLAIQNYQSIMYKALGFEGRGVLLISGCYGFMGIVGQIINLAGVSDKWPRVRTMCKSRLTPKRKAYFLIILYRGWLYCVGLYAFRGCRTL